MIEEIVVPPRKVPEKDDRYMGMAFMAAAFSKDPNTQVGAFIVKEDGKPLGWGYNGVPSLINDNSINWARPHKYDFIKHAEANAISHTNNRDLLVNATIYVTALPCPKCMLEIIDAKIKRVVFYASKPNDPSSSLVCGTFVDKTFDLAKKSGIILERYSGDLSWMELRIISLKENKIIQNK